MSILFDFSLLYFLNFTSPVGTINNDDALSLSINDVTVSEGNNGSTDAVFTVTLSNASAAPVSVDFASSDGTATVADNDYTAVNGTLTIPAGQSTGTITVQINGDARDELNTETYSVTLSNPTGGLDGTPTLADPQGQGSLRPTRPQVDGSSGLRPSAA